MQNWGHPFFFDRLQLYNSYLTLRGKYEYNRSPYFKSSNNLCLLTPFSYCHPVQSQPRSLIEVLLK